MQILMLTPLFPPDTGEPAPYAKLLAEKLNSHEVKVVAYGSLPESVENVQITSIEKRGFRFLRVWRAFSALHKSQADLWLIQAGPSTELPALIASFLKKTPIVLLASDPRAEASAQRGVYSLIRKRLQVRAQTTILIPTDKTLYLPTEWLPFQNQPATDEQQIHWWSSHTKEILSYGK